MPAGERAILIAAAQHGECSREQLSILTGYKRSSRDAYIQRLAGRGLVAVAGTIRPTDAGIKALGSDYEPLPTGRALQRHWLDRLPEGERKTLQVALDNYPRAVARSEIDNVTGYKRSSRDAYIQRLRTRQLVTIEVRGEVRASDNLF